MAEVAPLKPLVYAPAVLPRVVAPPYDVISVDERKALAARDVHNIVRLILPDVPPDSDRPDAKYSHAAELFSQWQADGTLVRDESPAFYRLDQTFSPPAGGPRVTRTGFLGLVRLVPFSERVVLPHERTLSGPKEDRLKLFRATRANLSPGFMLYRDPKRELDSALNSGEVVARFTSQAATEPGPIENVFSRIANPDAVAKMRQHLAQGTLLIADGHHRYETALHYSREVSAAGGALENGEHNYFMSFLVNEDDPGLLVFPTHRLVHALPQFRMDELLTRVSDAFSAKELSTADPETITAALRAAGVGQTPAVVAIDKHKRAVLLTLRSDFDGARHPTLGQRTAALRKTDVAILHAVILEHALGITLEAQAKQTNLVYLKDSAEAHRRIASGEGDVLFVMNATPVSHVRAVAEEGEVMPQKATYFYPKVLTGLAVHTLDPQRVVG